MIADMVAANHMQYEEQERAFTMGASQNLFPHAKKALRGFVRPRFSEVEVVALAPATHPLIF